MSSLYVVNNGVHNDRSNSNRTLSQLRVCCEWVLQLLQYVLVVW